MLGTDAMGEQVLGGPAMVSEEMVDDNRRGEWRNGRLQSMVDDATGRDGVNPSY